MLYRKTIKTEDNHLKDNNDHLSLLRIAVRWCVILRSYNQKLSTQQ